MRLRVPDRTCDPNHARVGVRGRVNAYGFAAGDPVSYADPFGLKVCFRGNQSDVRKLAFIAKTASHATSSLDQQICVDESSFWSLGNSRFNALHSRFQRFVNSGQEFGIALTGDAESKQITSDRIDIFDGAEETAYRTGSKWGKGDGGSSAFSYEQVLNHELTHHEPELSNKPMDRGTAANERHAVINGDNAFKPVVGRRQRCAY